MTWPSQKQTGILLLSDYRCCVYNLAEISWNEFKRKKLSNKYWLYKQHVKHVNFKLFESLSTKKLECTYAGEWGICYLAVPCLEVLYHSRRGFVTRYFLHLFEVITPSRRFRFFPTRWIFFGFDCYVNKACRAKRCRLRIYRNYRKWSEKWFWTNSANPDYMMLSFLCYDNTVVPDQIKSTSYRNQSYKANSIYQYLSIPTRF